MKSSTDIFSCIVVVYFMVLFPVVIHMKPLFFGPPILPLLDCTLFEACVKGFLRA